MLAVFNPPDSHAWEAEACLLCAASTGAARAHSKEGESDGGGASQGDLTPQHAWGFTTE